MSPSPAADITNVVPATGSPKDEEPTECRLLGPFAILVQLALGALALLALVYKRWRERPQRPVKIWFFDASKQVVGSILVHVANVFMSMLTSGRFNIKLGPATAGQGTARAVRMLLARGDDYVPNPCSFYLLNLAIDTTLGIPILIVLLHVTTRLIAYTPLGRPAESIQSGYYGHPPNAWWWLKQSFIYFCGLMGMKICVLIIFMMFPWISQVGDWALGWTEGNEQLQIVFVMMLFPLIMNAMQYYIIDSFIKKKESSAEGDSGSGTAAETTAYDELSISEGVDSDDDEEDGKNDAKDRTGNLQVTRKGSVRDHEYNPATDGDSQTVIGSSSSSRLDNTRVLPEELYPKE